MQSVKSQEVHHVCDRSLSKLHLASMSAMSFLLPVFHWVLTTSGASLWDRFVFGFNHRINCARAAALSRACRSWWGWSRHLNSIYMQTIGIQIDAKKSGVQILPVNLSVMHKTYCVRWPSAVTHPALELGQQVPFPGKYTWFLKLCWSRHQSSRIF